MSGCIIFCIAFSLNYTEGAYSIDAYKILRKAATVNDLMVEFKNPSFLWSFKLTSPALGSFCYCLILSFRASINSVSFSNFLLLPSF